MNFFPNGNMMGFIPPQGFNNDMNMIEQNMNVMNNMFNKFNEFDNRIKKLEQRIARLESQSNNDFNYVEPDNSLYMI